jgi:hypothetical protein
LGESVAALYDAIHLSHWQFLTNTLRQTTQRDAKLLEIGGGTNERHHKNMVRDLAWSGNKLNRLCAAA